MSSRTGSIEITCEEELWKLNRGNPDVRWYVVYANIQSFLFPLALGISIQLFVLKHVVWVRLSPVPCSRDQHVQAVMNALPRWQSLVPGGVFSQSEPVKSRRYVFGFLTKTGIFPLLSYQKSSSLSLRMGEEPCGSHGTNRKEASGASEDVMWKPKGELTPSRANTF